MNRHLRTLLRKATAIVAMAAVLGAPQAAWAETTIINFDTAGNWTQGSVALGSYASNHVYAESGWSFTGGPALRNTTTAQDGFAGALGTYSWRMNTNTAISWTATYTTGGTLTDFGFDARRWDSSPAPSMLVEYSINGGSSYTSTGTTISNTSLDESSAWKTFAFSLPSATTVAANQFVVRLTQSSGERVMIDNFSYTTGSIAPPPSGSNYYWVGSDTTRGGDGTWAGTGGTAWATEDADVAGGAWDATKIGAFAGVSGGTVTVTDTVDADAGLSFATSGYTFTGGTVSLGGANAAANTITTDAATAIAINSVLAGSTGLTKAGAGSLTLGGANTYSGGTVVSGGTLTGSTASLQGNITNNAAVVFDQGTNGTYSGEMTGSGSLTKSGAGNVTLSGSTTYSGGTTVSAGTLTVGNTATAGSISSNGNLTLDATGGLAFDRSDIIGFTGSVTGSGTLAQVGSGTLTLSRATAYGSDFTLRVQDGTVDLNRSGSSLVGILGPGNTVTLAGGTLQLTSNAGDETRFLDAAIDVQASSTIVINRTGTAANHSTTGFSAPITVSNGATLAFDYAGVIGSGFGGTTTYSAPVTLASNATFSVANSAGGTAEVIFSAAVGDGGAGYGLTKTGPQRLTLSGTNTYSGGTTVNGGTLAFSADANLGASSGGITLGGGTLEMTSGFTLGSSRTITATASTTSTLAVTSGTVSYGGAFTGSGNLDKAGAGRLVVSNASSGYSGTFTVSAGTLEVTGSNAFANASLSQTGGTLLLAPAGGGDVIIPDLGGSDGTTEIAAGATARVGGPGNSSYNGRVRGGGGLQKDGAGELTLNGDNDFAGNTRIAEGRLKLGAGGALSTTPLIEIDAGAIFDVTSKNTGLALGNGQRLGGRGTVLGNLEFGSLSQLAFSSSGPLLVGSGTASFAAGFGIGSIFGLGSDTPEGTYTLLDETTGGSISFANLANVGRNAAFDLGAGKSAYFQQGSLQVVVVPEPASLGLAAACLALAGLCARVRRRTGAAVPAA